MTLIRVSSPSLGTSRTKRSNPLKNTDDYRAFLPLSHLDLVSPNQLSSGGTAPIGLLRRVDSH